MIAYKFLSRGAVGPFSGFRWPTPDGGAAGPWVEARPEDGIHACRPVDLPYWIDEELWDAELSDDARETSHQLVASRGRLVRRVEAWPEIARAFAAHCSETVRARVEAALAAGGVTAERAALLRGYSGDAEAFARAGNVAAAAFAAARAAAVLAGDPEGFAAERSRQAAWLERALASARLPRA
ncbi:hypothetical protein PSR1_00596 [Anaeromyxobacter sp. PSR-1]|nr:hypothetical protein PSR1_00596 [Anaeromyxobacter sp. PSR-1]